MKHQTQMSPDRIVSPKVEMIELSIHFYLVVIHVLVVPVALQPVLGSVLLDKVVDAVPEVVGLQQQQLDDEVANLGLVVLVAAHRLQEEVRQSERATPGGGPFLWEVFGPDRGGRLVTRTSDSGTTKTSSSHRDLIGENIGGGILGSIQ